VSGPLIPYLTLPELPLLGKHTFEVMGQTLDVGPWSIKPFGTLVALGVYLGAMLCMRYAKRWEMHTEAFSRYMFWILVSGFVGGHVLDEIFYHPAQVLEDPLSLVKIWAGLSSFGGFTGGLIGTFVFKYRFGIKKILPFTDIMTAAFPAGWVFGRMGCSIVHDHPGMPSQLWFAVQYRDGSGGRFDLGLYEMIFAIVIAAVSLSLARKARPPGFFLGFTMLAYAPVRFALDFLRAKPGDAGVSEADPRYFMLTPAQWACFVMAAGAFYLLYQACASGGAGNDPYRDALDGVDPAIFSKQKRGTPPPAAPTPTPPTEAV
jgi:phosphatidylglycerol:prolipoprotein diacylglycerol transferase